MLSYCLIGMESSEGKRRKWDCSGQKVLILVCYDLMRQVREKDRRKIEGENLWTDIT